MTNNAKQFTEAMQLIDGGKLVAATALFTQLKETSGLAPLCDYKLADILNRQGKPQESYDLYYKAFEAMPNLASVLYLEQNPCRDYVFGGKNPEKSRTDCPLCGGQGAPHWAYVLPEGGSHNPQINPVRMWMYCQPCHHIFARDFPEKIFMHNASPRRADPMYFSYYSHILKGIKQFAPGKTLFEIGVGASECLLAAQEIGYDAFGIDVIERHVEDAKNLYGLNAATADFNEFQTDRKWDVIIMGDVLEHVNDPVSAVEKAASLLTPKGALWISTPNFESAFSKVMGHNDVMRKQQYHLNYFSRESLYRTLERFGLKAVDYQISGHYSGSMEIVATS